MEQTVNLWLESKNVSENEKKEIRSLTKEELQESFYKDVEFGTAGMRGLMGVGTNRLNTHTIKRAALAYAQFINGRDKNKRVAIAYDNRNNSKEFASITARVLAKENIEVLIYPEVMATPLLSFAVRELECGGGVIITASHNPKEYNGFKVYNEEGCQLIPELVETVIQNVSKIDNYLDINTDLTKAQETLIKEIDRSVVNKYIEIVLGHQLNMNKNEDFKIVYSPQHGAGINVIPEILDRANYNYTLVKSQSTLDGNFTNTLSPNPEDADAYVEAIKIAKDINANIVVTSDPDADRLGVAVRIDNEYVLLNGNETTAIILYYLLSQKSERNILPKKPIMINTVVTSDLGERICEAFDTRVYKTLTGFKYIGTLIDEGDNLENYVFGYEESYGSLPVPIIRDKDAASATLLLCEIASYYDKKGMTLVDLLDEIYEKYGYHYDYQDNVMAKGIDGPTKIKEILNKFTQEKLGEHGDLEIIKIENFETQESITKKGVEPLDFEKSSVIKIYFKDKGWIAIRPSGTEPKIKFYYGAVGDSKENVKENFEHLKAYVLDKSAE